MRTIVQNMETQCTEASSTIMITQKTKQKYYKCFGFFFWTCVNHIGLFVYHYFQTDILLYFSTLATVETPYPMLVLVGPPGAGKMELANKLTEDFPTYFGLG